jgi:hypothetical protein
MISAAAQRAFVRGACASSLLDRVRAFVFFGLLAFAVAAWADNVEGSDQTGCQRLDGGYTLNFYAEAQPSLYRSGVGAPNYQVFTGISLQLPSSFTSGWHIF